MTPFGRLTLFALIFIVPLVGLLATFSSVMGVVNPLDMLSGAQEYFTNYIAVGLVLLAIVLAVGLFIFLKEKFLKYA